MWEKYGIKFRPVEAPSVSLSGGSFRSERCRTPLREDSSALYCIYWIRISEGRDCASASTDQVSPVLMHTPVGEQWDCWRHGLAPGAEGASGRKRPSCRHVLPMSHEPADNSLMLYTLLFSRELVLRYWNTLHECSKHLSSSIVLFITISAEHTYTRTCAHTHSVLF